MILLRDGFLYLTLRRFGVDNDPFSEVVVLSGGQDELVDIMEARPLLVDRFACVVVRIVVGLHDADELDLRQAIDLLPVPIVEPLPDLVKDLSEFGHLQHPQVLIFPSLR